MANKKQPTAEQIKTATLAYAALGKIASEILDQYPLGSKKYYKALEQNWAPLDKIFYEYIHKNNIVKYLFR